MTIRESLGMQSSCKKGSDQSSVHSSVSFVDQCMSWWNSTGAQVPHSLLSNNHSLEMDSIRNGCPNVKEMQNQDSSSAQSTGQSHCGGSPERKCISGQSGYNEAYGRTAECNNQPMFPQGPPNLSINPYQYMVHMPYPCADPYYGGYQPAMGHIMQPQIAGMLPARVPLPPDFGDNEPIYVNPKQYHGILRRRQSRAKLEAQNKLIRDRKPYLHESRHLHAVKRARGCGGRFVNKNKAQESDDGQSSLDSAPTEAGARKPETGSVTSSVTSCSNVTDISNNDSMLRPTDPWLSGYDAHMGDSIQNEGSYNFNGYQLGVPVIQ